MPLCALGVSVHFLEVCCPPLLLPQSCCMIWKALLNRIDQLPVAVDRTWLPALQATQEVYNIIYNIIIILYMGNVNIFIDIPYMVGG